jgi:protein gp37
MSTAIEWVVNPDGTRGEVWNPTTGCDQVSDGCDNCYALHLAGRWKAAGSQKYRNDGNPATSGPGFGITVHPEIVNMPLRWRKPRGVFVNSMSDLFHKGVADGWIADIFAVMAATPRHQYIVLTKRHDRMRSLLNNTAWIAQVRSRAAGKTDQALPWAWPLPNLVLGVSVEDQKYANLRLPALIDTPAAVRAVSAEPLLGPIDLHQALIPCGDPRGKGLTMSFVHNGRCCEQALHGIGWVIAGGESGAGHRPVDADWIRTLRDQATAADVPFFFKQWGGLTPKAGGRDLDGRTWDQRPVHTTAPDAARR